MIFADRKYDFARAMRLRPCAGGGSEFIRRDLHTVMGWHELLTFCEGDRLCRALGSRVPLFTNCLEEAFSETRIQNRI